MCKGGGLKMCRKPCTGQKGDWQPNNEMRERETERGGIGRKRRTGGRPITQQQWNTTAGGGGGGGGAIQ